MNTLGADLAEVDSLWQAWILQKYNSTPQAAEIAQTYRELFSWHEYCEF